MKFAQKLLAAEFAIAIEWRYCDHSRAIRWADRLIIDSDIAADSLSDLALSRGPGETAGHLRALSKDVDRWQALSFFLTRFSTAQSLEPSAASHLAELLYRCTSNENPPKPFRVFVSHWDKIDLAISGVFGEPAQCIDEFLGDIRAVVSAFDDPEMPFLPLRVLSDSYREV